MSPRVTRSGRAREDLIEIYVYLAERSTDAAERFLRMAESTFLRISELPGLGRRWESPLAKLAGLRVTSIPKFRNYLVFYKPVSSGIKIIRVLHGARDLHRLIESLPPGDLDD